MSGERETAAIRGRWDDVGTMLDAWFRASTGDREAMLAAERLAAYLRWRDELSELLSEVYKPEGVRIWLISRNKTLDDKTPDEMYDLGRGDEVLASAERLVTGAFG